MSACKGTLINDLIKEVELLNLSSSSEPAKMRSQDSAPKIVPMFDYIAVHENNSKMHVA